MLAPDVLATAAAALSGAEHAILAMHHPPMPIGHPVMDDMLLTNPDALRGLLDEFPQVHAICVGHVHTPMVASFAGRPVLGAPGITSTLRFEESADSFTDRGVPPGIALHTVDNGEIVRTTFHFA